MAMRLFTEEEFHEKSEPNPDDVKEKDEIVNAKHTISEGTESSTANERSSRETVSKN